MSQRASAVMAGTLVSSTCLSAALCGLGAASKQQQHHNFRFLLLVLNPYQPTDEMKLAIAFTTLLFSGAVAFVPSAPVFSGRCIASSAATVKPTPTLFAGPEDEEGGLDLDLEEMFDMYVIINYIIYCCFHEGACVGIDIISNYLYSAMRIMS
jgi:hypothetical protein